MSNDGCMAVIVMVVVLAFLGWFGWRGLGHANGVQDGRREMEQEAIERGFAERVQVEPNSSETKFQWKGPK